MKIVFEKDEAESIFHSALCNGLGYVGGYGLQLEFDDVDYEKAKKTLKNTPRTTTICYEDVLVQILREGGELVMVDEECDGEYTSRIKIEDVYERLPLTPTRFLMEVINERDDAETADCIIQTVFFKDIVFG